MRLRSTRRCPSPHLLTPLHPTSRVSFPLLGATQKLMVFGSAQVPVKTAPWLAGVAHSPARLPPGKTAERHARTQGRLRVHRDQPKHRAPRRLTLFGTGMTQDDKQEPLIQEKR